MEKDLLIGDKELSSHSDKLAKSKKEVNDSISYEFKKIDNEEDEKMSKKNMESPLSRLMNAMFRMGEETLDEVVDKITTLLDHEINSYERDQLESFIIKNKLYQDEWNKIKRVINFCKNNWLSNCLSFQSLINLLSWDLNENELKNLLRISDNWYEHELNDILEFVDDKIILCDDISEKIVKLQKIAYEYHNMNLEKLEYVLLKDITLSNELIEKISKLVEMEVDVSIKDLPVLDNIEINEDIINKLTTLKGKINFHPRDLSILNDIDIDDKLIERIDILNNLEVSLFWENLLKIKELTDNDVQKLKYIKRKLRKIWNFSYIESLDFILKLDLSEIDKIVWDMRRLWVNDLNDCQPLYNISEEALEYCISNEITMWSDIEKVKVLYSISNLWNLKQYIHRKHEHLESNRTLSEEKFKEYFWWKWKFDKHEIKQWNIGLCYLYSWFEIFKKMNWFDVLIQTNFIENEDWWLIRFPFNTWSWIKVNKDEIDKTYEITNEEWKVRKMNINSISEFLWFKVLEIAYMKNKLINRLWAQKNGWTKDNPLDINITWEMLTKLEWWHTIKTLQELFWENNIVQGWVYGYNKVYWVYERLQKTEAPEIILNNNKKYFKAVDNRINKLFDLQRTWLISIDLSSCSWSDSLWPWMKKVERPSRQWEYSAYFLVDWIDIVDKFGNKIPESNLNNIPDVVKYKSWKIKVRILTAHAYSVEKCYINKKWEKRVIIVNPWHTDIKYDISLDYCKKLFDWKFWVIKVDNLFR